MVNGHRGSTVAIAPSGSLAAAIAWEWTMDLAWRTKLSFAPAPGPARINPMLFKTDYTANVRGGKKQTTDHTSQEKPQDE
jgi:hypothetical protein